MPRRYSRKPGAARDHWTLSNLQARKFDASLHPLRSLPRALTLVTLLAAASIVVGLPDAARIVSVEFGEYSGGLFVPRPSRVFNAGETVAVRVTVYASSPTGGRLTVRGALVHPLGPVLFESSQELDVPAGSSSWSFIFRFAVGQRLSRGYYRVAVKASLNGAEASYEAAFLLLAPVSLENRMELEYELEVRGSGMVRTLLLALPNDPTLEVLASPIITPMPSSILTDALGNRYALFENLEVRTSLRVKVAVLALQRVRRVAADPPLSAPLPPEVRVFLELSPYVESSAPDIVSLAQKIIGGAASYLEALRRISDFVSTHLTYDESISELPNYRALGALWALYARKGACLQFSRLYVALARAAGIPARVVEGFDVKPPSVVRVRYAHAYVEVYVPGHGWLPVEPQYPGSMVGLDPPVPGYIALLRGSDVPVELAGERREPPLFLLVYAGSISASLSYSASLAPLEPQLKRFLLSVEIPSESLYGEVLLLKPEATVKGARCEVIVRNPSSTLLFSGRCGEQFEVELDETGIWSVEVFAWAPGFWPFHASWSLLVNPRPLNLTVRVLDAALFKRMTIVVQTTPPVKGALIQVRVEVCGLVEHWSCETGPDGSATFSLGPLLLPCPLRASASTSPRGYTPANVEVSLLVALPPELLAAVALLALLAVLFKRKRRADAGKSSESEAPEPWV